MTVRKKPFIVPFLSIAYVVVVCSFSLLSIGIYQNFVSFQGYPVLPPHLPLSVNTGLPSKPSATPSTSGESSISSTETPPSSQASRPQLPPDAPNYMRLYPEMYAPGPQPGSEAARDMTLYLTFDDGPSKNTNAVLDILDQYGIKATFFVVPNDSQSCAERLREIHDRGHTIGVHLQRC